MTSQKNRAIKTAAALVLTGTLLLVSSCSGEDGAVNGYFTAEPEGKDYSFKYPEEWKVLRSDGMFAIESPVSEDGDKANISTACYELSYEGFDLTVYSESDDPYSDFLEDYINLETDGYIAGLRENYGDRIEFEEEAVDVVVGDGTRAAKKLVYHMKVGDEDWYFSTVLVILPDDQEKCYLYVLTYTAPDKETFDAHSAVFDTVVTSFEFTQLF